MGEWDSHSYHALFSTATRQIAVSRTEVGRLVAVRMEPRNEFLWVRKEVLECVYFIERLLRSCGMFILVFIYFSVHKYHAFSLWHPLDFVVLQTAEFDCTYHPSATGGACSSVRSNAMRPFSPRLFLTRCSTTLSSSLVKFGGSGTYGRRMMEIDT